MNFGNWFEFFEGSLFKQTGGLPIQFDIVGLHSRPIITEETLMGDFSYTGIKFGPVFEPENLALELTGHGFLVMNPITVALTGVFTRDSQLVGLAVDCNDGRALMLPLVEIPRSARTLMGTGRTLGESMSE